MVSVVEMIDLRINNPEEFDRAVYGDDRVPALPSGGDLTIITKDNGTESGRAIAVITWTCQVADGTLRRAQYTVPMRLLLFTLKALAIRYDEDGRARRPS